MFFSLKPFFVNFDGKKDLIELQDLDYAPL